MTLRVAFFAGDGLGEGRIWWVVNDVGGGGDSGWERTERKMWRGVALWRGRLDGVCRDW